VTVCIRGLSGRVVRRNTRFAIHEVRGDRDHAVLLPDTPGRLPARVVDPDTRRLIEAFTTPAEPAERRAMLAGAEDAVIGALILDGLLEIESDGHFSSGVDAVSLVVDPTTLGQPRTRLAEMSLVAIKHAERLHQHGVANIAQSLYRFGRVPLSPGWVTRASSTASVGSWLVAELPNPMSSPNDPWLRFPLAPRRSRPTAGSKLYVSTRPDDVAEALRTTLPIARSHGASMMKVAGTPAALLRPDNLVCYFPDPAGMRAAAEELAPALAGVRPHGVPFSAELTPGGLLSWGIDLPPMGPSAFGGAESWRMWACSRLASALAIASGSDAATVEPWRYALIRLELDGVNTTTWEPAPWRWN